MFESEKEKQNRWKIQYSESAVDNDLKKKKILSRHFKLCMLTLTWCHCSPAETKARLCTTAISAEHDLDRVGSACDGGWQGGATALLHQGCSITVRDCQVVVVTGGIGLNIKCRELQ